MQQAAYLILANGIVFEGFSFGAVGEVVGETVFTTGMTGYLETLTDKSYYGQIITQTFPLIGNYGVIPADFESPAPTAKGYIVKDWCQDPSNFRSEGDLDAFLRASGVVGLYGIDTRRLTKIIRESGVMNGKITNIKPEGIVDGRLTVVPADITDYVIADAVKSCSTKTEYTVVPTGAVRHNPPLRVALMDYGLKENIIRSLISRGIEVTVFPHDTTAEHIREFAPDGVMLTNGPGDPRAEENAPIIATLREFIAAKMPMFGICFGNQLLALAHGFEIEKLKYGHRGANQPAKDLTSGKTYITCQNHGYAVVSSSIDEAIAEEWFVNVNDGTNEGVMYKNAPICSVQFHPESCGGPQDTSWMFDKFVKDMEGCR